MQRTTSILVASSTEHLEVAARCRAEWDELLVTPPGLVAHGLARLRDASEVGRVIVVASRVEEPKVVRWHLTALGRRGCRVTWVAPSLDGSLEAATEGIDGVQLVTGDHETLEPLQPLEHDLVQRYCRHALAVSLVTDDDPAPLLRAIDVLQAVDAGADPSECIPQDDLPSLERLAMADGPALLGSSRPIAELRRSIRQVAVADLHTLVLAEPGTGAEAVAYFLHELGPRRDRPLGWYTAGGLVDLLARSRSRSLPGARDEIDPLSREAALVGGGTLFVEGVEELSSASQRALMELMVHGRPPGAAGRYETAHPVRIVAAAAPVLATLVAEGRFRADLYHLLAGVVLEVPPLRSRGDDLQVMIAHIVEATARSHGGVDVPGTLAHFAAMDQELRRSRWHGNLPALVALVNRQLLLGRAETPGDPLGLPQPTVLGVDLPTTPVQIRPLDEVVREYVTAAWEHRGDLSQRALAERLGRSVNTLKRILGDHRTP